MPHDISFYNALRVRRTRLPTLGRAAAKDQTICDVYSVHAF